MAGFIIHLPLIDRKGIMSILTVYEYAHGESSEQNFESAKIVN